MKNCELCDAEIPNRVVVDGKERNLQRRKYCLKCSPFGSHNTGKLISDGIRPPRKARKPRKDHVATIRWQRKARAARKQDLVDRLGGKCEKCGYNKCMNSLVFHHREPKDKSFALSKVGLLRKWEFVLKEVKKCALLCANCHGEVHAT